MTTILLIFFKEKIIRELSVRHCFVLLLVVSLMRSKIPSRVLTETGSCLPGVSESVHMLPCRGITREPGTPPGLGRQTDLDFLLVVVDLPGDVHVHRTPLPWFLQREQ